MIYVLWNYSGTELATTPCDTSNERPYFHACVGAVTTVPLSVCYGVPNLSVRVDTSDFVPYACDRAVTGGEYKGPEVPHRRLLFPVITWQRNGRTVLRGLSHLYFASLGWSKCWGHMLALCPFFL